MKKWKFAGLRACTLRARTPLASTLGLIASLALTAKLNAQVPDAPAAAPAAPAKNLWSLFCLTPEQSAKCKGKICNSPLGEMLKNAAKPVTLMSGGLLFGKCGVPTAEDLAKLKAEGKLDSAEGSAAQIKKSEAEAKARREAIRYLGTVDCNYWPEAKTALINGLRGDPNECVRYEAALALMRGCCCNKQIMAALKHSANGSDKDGFPAEDSLRVREAASEALAHCAAVYVEVGDTLEQKKLKETANPPQAHGKGLFGIFASASIIPPFTPNQTRVVAPGVREQSVSYVAPAPQCQVVQQPEKRRLFGRIDWPTSQARENNLPEIITTSAEGPIAPAWSRSVQSAPFSTATSTSAFVPPAVQPYRPAEEPAVPGRGVVQFDADSAR